MRKLYEMPNTVVNVRTAEEAEEYFRLCKDVGWTWASGNAPGWITTVQFMYYGVETCIVIADKFRYSRSGFYQSECMKIITLNELKELLMDYKVGDVLETDHGSRKVLGICGLVYLMSDWDDNGKYSDGFTKKELDEQSYKLQQPPSTIVELTLDQVAKMQGCDVEQLRIKDN